MPHANVWIRKEDWEAWQAIDGKAEWLHNSLNPNSTHKVSAPVKITQDSAQFIKEIQAIEPPKFCKNGHPSKDGVHCLKMGCVYGK